MLADDATRPAIPEPGSSSHVKQFPWLYNSARAFHAPCVLHAQLHGKEAIMKSRDGNTFWPKGQVQTRAHQACIRILQRATQAAAEARAAAVAAQVLEQLHQPAVTVPAVSPSSLPTIAAPFPAPVQTRAPGKRVSKRPLRLVDEPQPPAALARAPPDTPLHRSVSSLARAPQVWEQHDYAALRGLRDAKAVARAAAELPRDGRTQLLAGSAAQHALQETAEWKALCPKVEALCRRACDAVGVAHKGLDFIEPNLLVSQPGQGEQAPHWDCALAFDTPPTTITFLLQCSEADGIKSTAMPLYCARQAIPATQPCDAVGFGSSHMRVKAARRRRLQAAVKMLDKQQFHRITACVGDVLLCRQSVPHFGTRNDSSDSERIVLFAMLTASTARAQDDFQFFRWMLVAEAYGAKSEEYWRAVLQGKEHGPLERYTDEGEWRIAVAEMEKRGLLDRYYGTHERPQWHGADAKQQSMEAGRALQPTQGPLEKEVE